MLKKNNLGSKIDKILNFLEDKVVPFIFICGGIFIFIMSLEFFVSFL